MTIPVAQAPVSHELGARRARAAAATAATAARGKCGKGRSGFADCRVARGRAQARLPGGKARTASTSLAVRPRRRGSRGRGGRGLVFRQPRKAVVAAPSMVGLRAFSVGYPVAGTSNGIAGSTVNGFGRLRPRARRRAARAEREPQTPPPPRLARGEHSPPSPVCSGRGRPLCLPGKPRGRQRAFKPPASRRARPAGARRRRSGGSARNRTDGLVMCCESAADRDP